MISKALWNLEAWLLDAYNAGFRREPDMPQAKAEALIRQYYEAFNAGDASAMLACLAEDVRHDVNQGGTRVGKKLFTEF